MVLCFVINFESDYFFFTFFCLVNAFTIAANMTFICQEQTLELETDLRIFSFSYKEYKNIEYFVKAIRVNIICKLINFYRFKPGKTKKYILIKNFEEKN